MIYALIALTVTVIILTTFILVLLRTQERERRHLVNVAFSSSVSELITLDDARTSPSTSRTPTEHSELYQRAVDLDNPMGV